MTETLLQRYRRLLYIVRHGDAKAETEDPARPLTDVGRRDVQRMAGWAAAIGIKIDVIEHSGKLRAEQTAEIFAAHLNPPQGSRCVEGLKPNDAIHAVASRLGDDPSVRMLVGHLPSIERLIAFLTTENSEAKVVRLDAASVAMLARVESGWILLGLLQPDLVVP